MVTSSFFRDQTDFKKNLSFNNGRNIILGFKSYAKFKKQQFTKSDRTFYFKRKLCDRKKVM